jgi:predicted glycoside hydrolase/deacetylase ChbG (UPF0249 family)
VRRLVVNADDLGFTAGVNRGILEAHRAGLVTSASILVNTPGYDDAVRVAASAPALGIGLHLNLVQGRPLAKVPSLTDAETGELHPLAALAFRALTGRIDPRDVRAETEAQLARLRESGLAVTHLDGHRHAHALPGIWDPVVEVALRAGITLVRRPAESLRLRPLALAASAKKLALRAALAVARPGRTRSADHFLGLSLQGGAAGPEALLAALDRLRPGTTELMVHVGYADPELAALDDYTRERERELAVLTAPSVRERLQRGDLELIHFGRL